MYTFIVNANSRSGLGREIWRKIEAKLQTESIPYEVFFTQPHRHTEDIVRTLTSDHAPHTLVIVGGDGTVNEVINGIVHPENIILGYIPTGSAMISAEVIISLKIHYKRWISSYLLLISKKLTLEKFSIKEKTGALS